MYYGLKDAMGEDGLPEPEQVQCQWCYENEHSLFNRDRRIRSETAEAIKAELLSEISDLVQADYYHGNHVYRDHVETQIEMVCDRHIIPQEDR